MFILTVQVSCAFENPCKNQQHADGSTGGVNSRPMVRPGGPGAIAASSWVMMGLKSRERHLKPDGEIRTLSPRYLLLMKGRHGLQ
jgi:hypothetical protein